ncbi:CGP-CTERM sorting domain-containing protein, partial [Thermococcus alcaliphilus]|nr:CGP-CTERM sorting domain-containing protein [Thermococcus alcaliphilus]
MRSKKLAIGIIIFLMLFSVLTTTPKLASAQTTEKGPAADVIHIETRSDEVAAILDVAAGKLDIFLWDTAQSLYQGLSQEVLANLSLIKSASGYNDIEVNPVHDDDNPYLITVGEKKFFNPFACRDIRYALNFLISRQYIV